MPKHFVVTCAALILLTVQTGLASDSKKWGKVEKPYRDMTTYAKDTSAAAVKLFDVGEIELTLVREPDLYLTRHYQIKILDERAKTFADQAIVYWHKDKILKKKAQTILPNGKKIKVKEFRREEYKDNFKVLKFSFPSVEVGAILELEYQLWSDHFVRLEPWDFQDEIPTLESAVTLKMPVGFMFNSRIVNDERHQRVKRTEEQYMDVYTGRSHKMFKWRAVDLPAVREEPFISTLENYMARLNFQFVEYQSRYQRVTLMRSLDELCDEMLQGEYGTFLKPTKKVKALVAELLQDKSRDLDRIRTLYTYVRDQFDAETYGGYYVGRKQNEILKDQLASASERNLLLLSMLLAAGYDAKPTLISTRSHGRVDVRLPFLEQYDHTLVVVQLGRNLHVMDASDRFTPFGRLPEESLFEVGLVMAPQNPQFIHHPNQDIKSEERVESQIKLTASGELRGSTRICSIGYASRKRNAQMVEEGDIDAFLSNNIASDLEDFDITGSDTAIAPVASDTFATAFDFELANFVEVEEDEIYFRPALYQCMSKNVFLSDQREFPIEYGYRSKQVEVNTFYLPEGFQAVEGLEYRTVDNKYFTYQKMVVSAGEKLIFTRIFELKQHTVPPTTYQELKHDYARVVDYDQEQVVLRQLWSQK
ncbi:MAG: DUF3857 domain-containing protein [bacterium]